jgi:DNA mismatch endonuclease, patch repair protein
MAFPACHGAPGADAVEPVVYGGLNAVSPGIGMSELPMGDTLPRGTEEHGRGDVLAMSASSASRPPASSPEALRRMAHQRRRDTGPEMAIRRLLHARGLRYRVDAALPGMRRRADLLFISAGSRCSSMAVLAWLPCARHGTQPKSNAAWWAEKIETNERRDRDTDRRLTAEGWIVLRVWEHEVPEVAAERVYDAVSKSRNRGVMGGSLGAVPRK